jgi:hypothetical protein
MVFAQISSGQIVNTIILNDMSILNLFMADPTTQIPYDYVLQIDNQYPQPGIGWAFDGIQFYPPQQPNQSDDGDDS